MALAPMVVDKGVDPFRCANLALSLAYKANPHCRCYPPELVLAARVELASFQLRFTRLEDEADTRAWSQCADSNRSLQFTKLPLCLLSYTGKDLVPKEGIAPSTSGL